MDTNRNTWQRSMRAGLMAIIAASLLSGLALLFPAGHILPSNAAQPRLDEPVQQFAPQAGTAVTSEINLSAAAYTVDEPAGTLLVTATLAPTNNAPITVTFSTSNENANATSGDDYTPVRRRLTIPPGTALITIDVPIIDDTLVEGDETFEIGLSIAQNATLGEQSTATVQILNDDIARLRVEEVSVWENAGTAVVTVSQSTTSTLQTLFNIATQDGSAVAGRDYITVPPFTVLEIPPGAQQTTLNVTLLDDDTAEGDKTFQVMIEDAINAVIDKDTATVTVIDEDALPALRISDAAAPESDGEMRFTLTLDAAAETPIHVDYLTADGTATAPSDYTLTGGQLTIPAGTTTATLTVPLKDDGVVENDETFSLNLSKPVAAVIATGQATGAIQNDDADPQGELRLYLPGIVVD